MARLNDLVKFAQFHNLKIGTIADLISYRRRNESLVEKIYEGSCESICNRDFKLSLYAAKIHYAEHIALVKGDISDTDEPVLVRMHAVDIIKDIVGKSEDNILQQSIDMIDKEGRGVIVILRPPNATILSDRLLRKNDSDNQGNKDHVIRDYGIGAQILLDLGVKNMVLLSNSPKSVVGLEGYDLHISGHIAVS